jgi:hypothetical protein
VGHDSGWIFEVGQRRRNRAPASTTPPGTNGRRGQYPKEVVIVDVDNTPSLSDFMKKSIFASMKKITSFY